MYIKKSLFAFLLLLLFSFVSAQDVKDVYVKLCNDGVDKLTSRYTLPINPGERKDLCVYIENHSKEPVKLSYTFPLGTLTDHDSQLCDTSTGFMRFFEDKSERVVELPASSSKTINEKVFVPLGMSGMQYGCLTYNVMKPISTGAKKGMFEIVIRKAVFVNLFVGGNSKIQNSVYFVDMTGGMLSLNPKIKGVLDKNNKLSLSFGIKNGGNVVQDISLSGMIYNMLGFQKEFDGGKKRLMPGETHIFEVSAGVMPFYNGLFTVDVGFFSQPFFDFVPTGLSEDAISPIFVGESGNIFVFSWIWVVVLVLLLFLIRKKLFSKKKQVVIQNIPPQQQFPPQQQMPTMPMN